MEIWRYRFCLHKILNMERWKLILMESGLSLDDLLYAPAKKEASSRSLAYRQQNYPSILPWILYPSLFINGIFKNPSGRKTVTSKIRWLTSNSQKNGAVQHALHEKITASLWVPRRVHSTHPQPATDGVRWERSLPPEPSREVFGCFSVPYLWNKWLIYG